MYCFLGKDMLPRYITTTRKNSAINKKPCKSQGLFNFIKRLAQNAYISIHLPGYSFLSASTNHP